MKIKIDRNTFAKALADVAPFAPAKTPMMILKNARITTKGNRMKIEANDTKCSMVKYIETLECDTDGTFLIDIADLNRYIAKVKGNTIEVEVNDNTIHLTHSKGSAEFQSGDASEYPTMGVNQDNATEVTLDAKHILAAISQAKGFVSTDTLRPQMCAIYAYIRDGEFGYCASDTHKLIYWHTPVDINANVNWFITPPIFAALSNACKTSDTVKIQITDKHVSYRLGNTIIQSTQVVGKFPDFKRVIPATWNIECSVDKDDITDSLGRISLFCDNIGCAKVDVSPMDITLSVDNIDYMKKSIETISHNGCNGEIKIGVNVNNLLSSINVFDNRDILLRMTDASRPILFEQEGNDNLQVIAMPMQLTN